MATSDSPPPAAFGVGDQVEVGEGLPEHLAHYKGKRGIVKTCAGSHANIVLAGAKGGGAVSVPRASCNVLRRRLVLPSTVYPTHYFVSLAPDLENWVSPLFPSKDKKEEKEEEKKTLLFDGVAEIDLRVDTSTSEIVLNSLDIQYGSVTVTQGANTFEIEGSSVVLSEKPEKGHNPETATIPLPGKLEAGQDAKLVIKYKGELNDKMKGFYRSKYTKDGEEKYAATTQFEATDARRAFPCWDEPAVKSAFTIQLTVPDHLVALSNMPEASSEALAETKQRRVTFEKSAIMSTYLVAFVIGEFEHIESKTKNGTLFRVWTPLGKIDKGKFALDVGVRCLEFFESYYKVPFPLPKQDMIGIADFAAGAMENWGLVTYRETAILCDETSSVPQRQWVAIVICHELAHQWFGNLVTMQWWDNLWLNEGFACFMEYLAADNLFPEWNIWSNMVSSEFVRATGLDAMLSSHAIEVDIFAPAEVDEVFDAISYSKGACVIRMIEKFIGSGPFQNAIAKYLAHFQYKNAVTADLWSFLAKESGEPIADMMSAWTREMGYPVLHVAKEGSNFTLKQTRFLSSGPPTEEQDRVTWSIPVVGLTDKGEVVKTLMKNKEGSMPAPDASWVKFNSDYAGYYIVNYSDEMLAGLAPAVESQALGPIDRLSLINDVGMLCKAGIRPTAKALDLFKAYQNETEYAVWSTLLGTAGEIAFLLRYSEQSGAYDTLMQNLLRPLGEKLGWDKQEGDSDDLHKLRNLVISSRARYNDPDVIKEAQRRFGLGFDAKELTKDLLVPVYSTVLKNGGRAEYEKIWKRCMEVDDKEEKDRILRVIGLTGDPDSIAETLKKCLSDDVRGQDKVFVLRGCFANKRGGQMSWEYLVENWDALWEAMGSGMLATYMPGLPKLAFTTDEKAKEVSDFFDTKKEKCPCEMKMNQSLEGIRCNASWLKRDLADIEAWLKGAR